MSPHRFTQGARVEVASLRQSGTILELLHGGRYRVAIASLTIVCQEDELALSHSKQDLTPRKSVKHRPSTPPPPTSIDLHGLTVDDASRALEAWLSQIIIHGVSQAKVIHGLGTGRVQQASHEVLRRYAAVRAFRVNVANPGETDIFL